MENDNFYKDDLYIEVKTNYPKLHILLNAFFKEFEKRKFKVLYKWRAYADSKRQFSIKEKKSNINLATIDVQVNKNCLKVEVYNSEIYGKGNEFIFCSTTDEKDIHKLFTEIYNVFINMSDEYYEKLKKRIAFSAIGMNTLRFYSKDALENGIKLIDEIRGFYLEIDLRIFKNITYRKYIEFIDSLTNKLVKKCKGFVPWGLARKAINLFVRDCCYNKYLCEKYSLDELYSILEIPIDRKMAKIIYEYSQSAVLPKWTKYSDFDREVNEKYQKVALSIANQKRVLRIHLEEILWISEK